MFKKLLITYFSLYLALSPVVNATIQTQTTNLSDNLKANLGSEVLSVASAKLANEIGDAKATGKLNEFTHKAAHAALGCAGAKIQGKDCGAGAVGAVVGEIIAETITDNTLDNKLDKDTITAISRVGTAVVSQGLGKDVKTADQAATNAVKNNLCSGSDCYGNATQKRLQKSLTNPNTVITFNNQKDTDGDYSNYQVRTIQDKNGKLVGYSAYNPKTNQNILMKPEELTKFKGLVENNLMSIFENRPNYQNTVDNAMSGLHDDGKTGGITDSWKQYVKSGDLVFDLAGGLGSGIIGKQIIKTTTQGTKLLGQKAEQKFVKTILEANKGTPIKYEPITTKPLNIKDIKPVDVTKLKTGTLDNRHVERDFITNNNRFKVANNRIEKRNETVEGTGGLVKDAIKAVGDALNDGF